MIEERLMSIGGFAARSGSFLVDDVDTMHSRAIAAGASDVLPPQDYEWKPRTSIVDDPSGNRIALSQA